MQVNIAPSGGISYKPIKNTLNPNAIHKTITHPAMKSLIIPQQL